MKDPEEEKEEKTEDTWEKDNENFFRFMACVAHVGFYALGIIVLQSYEHGINEFNPNTTEGAINLSILGVLWLVIALFLYFRKGNPLE